MSRGKGEGRNAVLHFDQAPIAPRSNWERPLAEPETPIRIYLVCRRLLDCSALSSLLRRLQDCQLVGSTDSLVDCLEECCRTRPKVVILDACFSRNKAFTTAQSLLERKFCDHVLFLDERARIANIQATLSLEKTGYITRESSSTDVQAAILGLLHGRVVVDTGPTKRIRLDCSHRHPRLVSDQPSLIDLSKRELEVLRYVSQGLTIAEVAELLGLAESTVDNHKSRLKKKLHVKKIAELTRIAMQEGLID